MYTTSLDDDIPADDAEEAYPATLFLVDVKKGQKIHYKPAWSPTYHYELWSPNGAYAVFLRGDYGPIDVVEYTRLGRYLKKYSGAYRVVNTNKNPSNHNPAHTMEVLGWKSNTILLVKNGCCGHIWKTEYNLASDSYRRLECAYGYCMRTTYNNFEAHQKDIVIDGGMLTKYNVSKELKRYFAYIDERCFRSASGKVSIDYESEFSLSFALSEDGKVISPKITDLKTEKMLPDASKLSNCLKENAKEISFTGIEMEGTNGVTVRVVINSGVP